MHSTRVRQGKPVSPGFLFATLLWHEVLADAKRSVVIGPLVYITGTMQGWSVWQLGFALIFGGYLGPAALDMWAAKFKGGGGA